MIDPKASEQLPDPEFEASEHLFRRLHPDHFVRGAITDAFLPFPSFSVNREKYSQPEDVLREHPHYGIAAFAVGDIPESLDTESGQVYWFGVEHVPLIDNYAHSEVHSFHDEVKAEPPRVLRKKFRDLLRRQTVVLKEPSPQ
jgi:hypothetical protein